MRFKTRKISISRTRIKLAVVVLGAAWGYVGPIAPAVVAAADEADVNRIRMLWQKQSHEIATGKFEVVLFRYFDSSAKLLSRADALKRLKSVGDNASPALIEPLFDDVAQRGWKKQKSTLWGTSIDVAIDGSKIANSYRNNRDESIRVFDGDSEISYRVVNRQASITAGRSQIHQVDLDTIHIVPGHLINWEKPPTVERVDEGRTDTLRSGGITVRFDRASGFVRQLTESRNGKIDHEVLQFGPKDVHKITIAKTVADLRIENDYVEMMSIYLINPQSINGAIPDEAFRVAVPAGTLIVDHRKDLASPHIERVANQLNDVKRYREKVPGGDPPK